MNENDARADESAIRVSCSVTCLPSAAFSKPLCTVFASRVSARGSARSSHLSPNGAGHKQFGDPSSNHTPIDQFCEKATCDTSFKLIESLPLSLSCLQSTPLVSAVPSIFTFPRPGSPPHHKCRFFVIQKEDELFRQKCKNGNLNWILFLRPFLHLGATSSADASLEDANILRVLWPIEIMLPVGTPKIVSIPRSLEPSLIPTCLIPIPPNTWKSSNHFTKSQSYCPDGLGPKEIYSCRQTEKKPEISF